MRDRSPLTPPLNHLLRHRRPKIHIPTQHLDTNCPVPTPRKHNRQPHRLRARRPGDVVAVTRRRVRVDRALEHLAAGVQRLGDVEFAAARGPAGAGRGAVLQGARDVGVEEPDGGLVGEEGGGWGRVRHGEFEEEQLRGGGWEAVCRGLAGVGLGVGGGRRLGRR